MPIYKTLFVLWPACFSFFWVVNFKVGVGLGPLEGAGPQEDPKLWVNSCMWDRLAVWSQAQTPTPIHWPVHVCHLTPINRRDLQTYVHFGMEKRQARQRWTFRRSAFHGVINHQLHIAKENSKKQKTGFRCGLQSCTSKKVLFQTFFTFFFHPKIFTNV